MSSHSVVPLIDLVFLTLGSVLAAMTQMERVQTIPVEIAEVGEGSVAIRRGRFDVVSLTRDGMTFNGRPVSAGELAAKAAGREIVLRADRALPTQRTLAVLAQLAKAGADVSVQVTGEPQDRAGPEGSN